VIELDSRDAVTIMRINRGKGNAVNIGLLEAMETALDEVGQSPARAAIVTGQGSVFGAGVDLPELVAGGEAYVRQFIPLLARVFERLARFPKPLVAAVNGHAIAGGAIMMLACDQRILVRGPARVGLTEIQVGVQFPAWALEIARFATPPEHFQTLICTGRTWPAEEAFARGLADELVEPDQLESRALAIANELGAFLPETFAATKLAVRRPLFEAVEKAIAREGEVVESWSAPDVLARIGAFVERNIKRKA